MTIRSKTAGFLIIGLIIIGIMGFAFGGVESVKEIEKASGLVWWMWLVILFLFTIVLGMIAVVTGIGGGVLFVPIVSGFFPFHLDFVRGTGLMIALAGALSAGPKLLTKGLASLRLTLPLALIASVFSILGALVGLSLPINIVQIALGSTIIIVVFLLIFQKKLEYPEVLKADSISKKLKINGTYLEESSGRQIDWKIHRTPVALILFMLIGFVAGLFGLGAGWANVPVLNLILGAPLKIAVATSIFIITITNSTAAWVYLSKGAVLPLIAIPSIAGMMIGTRIGARILLKTKPESLKWLVISILFFAGLKSLLKGLGI